MPLHRNVSASPGSSSSLLIYSSDKGSLGKIGKVSNFGAVGDASNKGNVGKISKISNFGAVGDGSDNSTVVKLVKLVILVL